MRMTVVEYMYNAIICITGIQVYINLVFPSNSYINNNRLMFICPILLI